MLSPHNNCVGKLDEKFFDAAGSCFADDKSPLSLGSDG